MATKRKASTDGVDIPNKQPRTNEGGYISGIIPLGGTPLPLTPSAVIGPPPPYPEPPLIATSSSEEFTCSSPSQFLHSPNTIHTTSPGPKRLIPSSSSNNDTSNNKKLRSKVLSLKKAKAIEMKLNYEKMLQEKFFLEGGGVMIDYQLWRRKPNILKDQYLKQHDIDTEGSVYHELLSPRDLMRQDITLLETGQTLVSMESFPNTQQCTNTSIQLSTPITSLSSPTITMVTTSGGGVRPSLSSDISHEDIVMRARHEADVMKAISELRKEGLWSTSRLPKVQEPSRGKNHWDYVLEEMRWLATDFINERKWKINACKKLSRIIYRHNQEKEQHIQKSVKEEQTKLRKIASSLAKEVRHFWDSIQKIVEHKQQLLLEEKRRKAMDIHLNFIVDQTQKYSNWLTEGLQPTDDPSLSSTSLDHGDDVMFTPTSGNEGTDDEETIDTEEIIAIKEGELDYESEINQLKLEGEMPLQELIDNLPTDLLQQDTTVGTSSNESGKSSSDDDMSDDNETTIAEQEEYEGDNTDSINEIDMLNREGDMPIDELLKVYMDQPREGEGEEEEEEEFGIQSLLSDNVETQIPKTEQGLTDVAAVAQELQPKGTTLSTTEVKTKVPFLLRHELREYQHIGLDWLVTMNDRVLNGILADEMGLGKTIQTIALLAHLACEKSNWGPHLIIVPTSVMLNWEFEFKKWCPGFKILTYFGSFKERKQKRVGWSKCNAFHVCITSYNIAVQDYRSFRQKKWNYLILDEAQNIKNFKSQRWQTLLTFNSTHRLLLTGTPLQNNLMELWSLMHFLMPEVFSSHTDFKEWFSNPLTGMIEGSTEYNESIVERLHQVLRPFILRRLKSEVEKQLPSKYEHLVLCKLSKRQRFLYEEYISRTKTKETLSTGNYLSVINVLMQLRKVCNHPDLFELRPVASPLCMNGLLYTTASLVLSALSSDPFKVVSLDYYNMILINHEFTTNAFETYRSRQLQAPRSLLLDHTPDHTPDHASKHNWIDIEPLINNDDIKRECLHRINTYHCRRQPIYGHDMIQAVRTIHPLKLHPLKGHTSSLSSWLWSGYVHCTLAQLLPHKDLSTNCLNNLLISHEKRLTLMSDILSRFILTVLPILVPSIRLHVCHPQPSDHYWALYRNMYLTQTLSSLTTPLNQIMTSFRLQFPETRLVQYDCGKLQNLDLLLRRLRTGGHRVLVFTQMSRMLDILEVFLTYHGYTYLRLDGATPVHKRQLLMEHFNNDPRVFCFILSTRSGGLGVNLTGADTVIFYDSDWNPTMDAQAQDRCHRIGQTRDVHIYRLICQRTIEENILKKASQKRLLGDLAIESGSFTTEFFKKSSINELFDTPNGTYNDESIPTTGPTGPTGPAATGPTGSTADKDMTPEELEKLLLQAEEDHDVKAAKMARAEQVAERAEFDEQYMTSHNVNNNTTQVKDIGDNNKSKLDEEFEGQLSGVELYAMKFIEMEKSEIINRQLRQAEENIELAKREWEFGHLQKLRQDEEKQAQEEEEECLNLTYDRPELVNKIFMDGETGEEMPIWLPPTPPNDNDHYIDVSMETTYDTSSVMRPDSLAGYIVYSDDDYDVFGLQKPFHDQKPTRKLQKSTMKYKRDNMSYPQSLFWRRYTPDALTSRIRKLSPQTKKDGPEWLPIEDWVLIKGLTTGLDLPLLLNATVPAQMPNWTVLADFVTSFSKTKRSAVQCKDHIVGVLIPHEEQFNRSQQTQHKGRRDQRCRNLVLQDKGKDITKLFDTCFLWINKIDGKTKQQNTSLSDVSPRSSMHADLLLKDYDISYGVIQTPSSLAQQRAERIQSEIPRPSLLSQGPPYNVQMARANLVKPFTPAPPPTPPTAVPAGYTGDTPTTTRTPAPPPPPPPIPIKTTEPTYPILSTVKANTTATVTAAAINTSSHTTSTASKPYSGVDISKGLFLGQRLTQQQILLLRQTALQQQQAAQIRSIIQPNLSSSSPTATVGTVLQNRQKGTSNTSTAKTSPLSAKLQLPTGIDQLRSPSITLSAQRPTVPSTLVRAGLPSRSMQTDEVLALLRQQQALRLAMQTQTVKLSANQSSNPSQATTSLNEAIAVAAMAAAIKPTNKPILINPVTTSTTTTSDTTTLTDPRTSTHN